MSGKPLENAESSSREPQECMLTAALTQATGSFDEKSEMKALSKKKKGGEELDEKEESRYKALKAEQKPQEAQKMARLGELFVLAVVDNLRRNYYYFGDDCGSEVSMSLHSGEEHQVSTERLDDTLPHTVRRNLGLIPLWAQVVTKDKVKGEFLEEELTASPLLESWADKQTFVLRTDPPQNHGSMIRTKLQASSKAQAQRELLAAAGRDGGVDELWLQ